MIDFAIEWSDLLGNHQRVARAIHDFAEARITRFGVGDEIAKSRTAPRPDALVVVCGNMSGPELT